MASLRPFRCSDLLQMGLTNINPLTETYHPGFYYEYISVWPEYCNAFETMSGAMSAYILGKVEGKGKLWHGHVTAVTVAPEFRRLGMARDLMTSLEDTTDEHEGYFVDLFVREKNALAIGMYRKFGYEVYRRVLGYYGDNGEDAYDMRRAGRRDVMCESTVPMDRPVRPSEISFG